MNVLSSIPSTDDIALTAEHSRSEASLPAYRSIHPCTPRSIDAMHPTHQILAPLALAYIIMIVHRHFQVIIQIK